jgi:chorismate mutase
MGLFGRKNKYDEIEKWRKKIDKIDIRIVRLLNRRARYADEIGKLKQELNLPIYSPEREKQVIENVTKHNFGPLSDMAIKRLYERIIDESRRLERESAEQREKLQRIYNFKNGNVKLLDNLRYLILLLSLLLLFYLNKNLFIINIPPTKLEIVDIPKNSSFKFVLETLSDRGLIRDKFLALTFSKVFGYDKKIKSGRYILSDNLPVAVVLNEIVNPKLVFAVTVTIPEGLTAKRIARILKSKVGVDSAKFMSLVNSPEFARKLGIESNTLEGYLMPDTYNFIWGDEEENIISRLVEEFKKFYNDTFENKSERTWIHNSPSYYSCINC